MLQIPILFAAAIGWVVAGLVLAVFLLVLVAVFIKYWNIWFRAYMSSANISLMSLIGMSFRRVNADHRAGKDHGRAGGHRPESTPA